jgi:hypothetical protein
MNPTVIIFSGMALVVVAMVSLLLLISSPMSILFQFQNNNVHDRFTYNAGEIGLLSNNNQNIQDININRLLLHPISFANDTLFPQTFQSSAMASNEITLSNGNTLPARPMTITVNKIASNNTLVITVYSFSDKYLLNGNLKGPANKPIENTKDHAKFSLAGVITLNKNTPFSVISNITETTNKQVTLDISNTKSSSNFKASIGFTAPSGGEAPLAGI